MYYINGNYEAFARPEKPADVERKSAYLVGAGLASLAAACFLVRDGQMKGEHIHILEDGNLPGGACDGVHIIAALKLNYKYNSVSLVEEENVRITRRQVLPQIGTAVDEAIIIDTDHKKLSLIEKKYLIDGKMDTYLNSQWIKGEEKLTDRQKISTMKKVVNKINR